jgi:cytochrome oxidase Cu insertion factor (SCO1/SenC/PrrC family)
MVRSVFLPAILGSILQISMAAQSKPYPKPEVPSATGQHVQDFTLKDQSGKPFKLSRQRGKWVLLFFYRGYW